MEDLNFKLERFPDLADTWSRRRAAVNEAFDDMTLHWQEPTGLFDQTGTEIRVGDDVTLRGTAADAAWPYSGPVGHVLTGELVALDAEDYIPLLVHKFPQPMREIRKPTTESRCH